MSHYIFLVDLKAIEYDKLVLLSKEVIQFCLKNNIGAAFKLNSEEKFAKLLGVKNYFVLQDNFVYDEAYELLCTEDCFEATTVYDLELEKKLKPNVDNKEIVKEHADKKFRKEFYKKFKWIAELLDIVFRHGFISVDIYIDEVHDIYDAISCGDTSENFLEEYSIIKTNRENALKAMCDSIIVNNEESDFCCYHFPYPVKYEIIKNNKKTK